MTLGIGTGALVAGVFGMNVGPAVQIIHVVKYCVSAFQPVRAESICLLRHVCFRDKSRIWGCMGRFTEVGIPSGYTSYMVANNYPGLQRYEELAWLQIIQRSQENDDGCLSRYVTGFLVDGPDKAARLLFHRLRLALWLRVLTPCRFANHR